MLKLQKEYLVDLEDAVVAVRDKEGSVKLHQIHNLTAAGAISGGFWGALIGLLFLSPILGAAIGAGAGAVGGALTDIGIDDNFMKDLASTLQPGSSALFVLVRKMTADKVLDQFHGMGGKVLQTSLSTTTRKNSRPHWTPPSPWLDLLVSPLPLVLVGEGLRDQAE